MNVRNAILLGVIGLAVAALGWVIDPARLALGWVAAFSAWLAWPVGSMALLMIHALTGGRWGDALAPGLRVGVATLPLVVPALVPVLLLLPALYPWARAGAHFDNAFYLNLPFAAGRLVVYLVSWFGLAWLALRPRGLSAIAPAGLILLAVTFTFATIDLTMSLDPKFNSSVYSLIALTGAGLVALSAGILTASARAEQPVLPDLGKLLLGVIVLWTYLDFMQLLIIWESDLSTDAPWYLLRSTGGWGVVALLVSGLHFMLPFALLLSGRLRHDRRVLGGVAVLLLVTELVRAWWIVLPTRPGGLSWIDLGCAAAFAGFAGAVAMRRRQTAMVANPV